MRIVTAPDGVVSVFRPREGIGALRAAGFEELFIDFGAYCPIERIWPENKKLKEEYIFQKDRMERGFAWMKEGCVESGLRLSCGQLPMLGWGITRTDLGDKLWLVADKCLNECVRLGLEFVIAPPLFAGLEPEEAWEHNRKYYLWLASLCEGTDLKILLQNECRDVSGHLIRGLCADAGEAFSWVGALNEELGMERFGFCLDLGICNLCGQDARELAVELAPVLEAVIVRDNDGRRDYAMLPFTVPSGVDWLGVFRGLREIDYDGLLIFRYGMTAGCFSPLLKSELLPLAKATADYVGWQVQLERTMKRYSSLVLFGAGNMCRNYMKNYGAKYPPLFTCDNDASRWGEVFCGLTIKSPEALLSIPEDCGVLICNIYYREIEQQLRGMGVKNIAYFNDEYMPSFDFERLAMR